MLAKFKTKEVLLAYMAGLVDGEGCILIRKRLPTPKNRIKAAKYSVSFSIAMTDLDPVHLVAEYCNATHLVKRRLRRDGYKPIFELDLENERAISFIQHISPYLVCKADQAKIALEMAELRSTSRLNRTKVVSTNISDSGYSKGCKLKSMGLSDEFIASCEVLYHRIKNNNTRTGQPGRFGSEACL